MACIYKITNIINGKIYIGQTKQDLKKRIRQHRSNSKRLKTYLYSSMIKYGKDNFKFEKLIDGNFTREKLNELEIKFIQYYNSNNSNIGYNLTSGGDYPIIMDFKRRGIAISKAKKGISVGKGIPKGREHIEKVRQKLITFYKENNHPRGRKCYLIANDNSIIRTYDYIKEAEKELKIDHKILFKLSRNEKTRFNYGIKIRIDE